MAKMTQLLTTTLTTALILGLAGVGHAAIINISVGESSFTPSNGGLLPQADLGPGQSGFTSEVLAGETWNNIADGIAAQALFDSTGAGTSLTAIASGRGEFIDGRGDTTLAAGIDVTNTILSSNASSPAGSGTTATLTISGFTANQQLGNLEVWALAKVGGGGPMTVTVNGVALATGIFDEGADVFANVVADANGDVIVTATNAFSAVTLDAPIPEPASIVLLGLGGLMMLKRQHHSTS